MFRYKKGEKRCSSPFSYATLLALRSADCRQRLSRLRNWRISTARPSRKTISVAGRRPAAGPAGTVSTWQLTTVLAGLEQLELGGSPSSLGPFAQQLEDRLAPVAVPFAGLPPGQLDVGVKQRGQRLDVAALPGFEAALPVSINSLLMAFSSSEDSCSVHCMGPSRRTWSR